MLRLLIASFQKTPAAATAQASHVDPARLEFERLFRDDLAAHDLTIAQVRGAGRAANPNHV